MIKNIDYKIIKVVLLVFAFFPLIPNKLKGLPVILLFASTIFIYFKNKKDKFNFKEVFIQCLPFLVLIVSLIYTNDFFQIDKKLSTRLSLLVVPISFGFIKTTSILKRLNKKFISLFSLLIFAVSMIYCFLILGYLFSLGVSSNKMSLYDALAYLTNEMKPINQHPIYISIMISISLLLSFHFLSKTIIKKKIFLLPLILLQLLTLIILNRRGVIFSFTISSTIIVYYYFKNNNVKIILKIFFLLITLSSIIYVAKTDRFQEIFNKNNFSESVVFNSTNLRFHIYSCSLRLIKISPIYGYGIGDVQNELNNCYEAKSPLLLINSNNSHNQYLSYFLSAGIFGFFSLLYLLLFYFKRGVLKKNRLLLIFTVFFSIIMFFENILERQTGVIMFSYILSLFNSKNFS